MFFFNIANDYVKFNISLHRPKYSSPGTVCLTNYKRRHISASGSAQTVAKPGVAYRDSDELCPEMNIFVVKC